MNWFKRKQWKKIGEATVYKSPEFSSSGYYRYAVMECIMSNGDRKYKRVFMAKASWSDDLNIESQCEDPLKEINDILRTH